MKVYKIELTESAIRDLKKVPKHIIIKLMGWVDNVREKGLPEIRKLPGFHDEPLKGNRKGQRSIRLSKSYRAIYIVDEEKQTAYITVLEVNIHEY
jgi:toxin HigB-1